MDSSYIKFLGKLYFNMLYLLTIKVMQLLMNKIFFNIRIHSWFNKKNTLPELILKSGKYNLSSFTLSFLIAPFLHGCTNSILYALFQRRENLNNSFPYLFCFRYTMHHLGLNNESVWFMVLSNSVLKIDLR